MKKIPRKTGLFQESNCRISVYKHNSSNLFDISLMRSILLFFTKAKNNAIESADDIVVKIPLSIELMTTMTHSLKENRRGYSKISSLYSLILFEKYSQECSNNRPIYLDLSRVSCKISNLYLRLFKYNRSLSDHNCYCPFIQ